MATRLLVVDDEREIRRVVSGTLTRLGFEVSECSRGEEAIPLVGENRFDAILLDLNMPGMGGVATCRAIRKLAPNLPIMMLTVRGAEDDKVNALDAGADDYVTKPFGFRELVARINALVRRTAAREEPATPALNIGHLEIDPERRTLLKRGSPVRLTATEFELLYYLMQNKGRVVTYRKLLCSIWGNEYRDNVEYLRTYMRQLRRKIEDDPSHPQYLLTEPYVGYHFRETMEKGSWTSIESRLAVPSGGSPGEASRETDENLTGVDRDRADPLGLA